jgi:hypothetical protein
MAALRPSFNALALLALLLALSPASALPSFFRKPRHNPLHLPPAILLNPNPTTLHTLPSLQAASTGHTHPSIAPGGGFSNPSLDADSLSRAALGVSLAGSLYYTLACSNHEEATRKYCISPTTSIESRYWSNWFNLAMLQQVLLGATALNIGKHMGGWNFATGTNWGMSLLNILTDPSMNPVAVMPHGAVAALMMMLNMFAAFNHPSCRFNGKKEW